MRTFTAICLLVAFASVPGRAQTDIHRVDFKNFAYRPSCTDLGDGDKIETLPVKNGQFTRQKKMDGYVDTLAFSVVEVTYGDLTGDHQDEAVVRTTCNTGGTGEFTEGFIYTMKGGAPVLLARVEGGDRAEGGLLSLTVENGVLVVDANDGGRGACCAEFAKKTRMRLSGDKLVEVAPGVWRALFTSTRVAFARGASSAAFDVTLKPSESARYTLGARAGQVMTVTVDTDAVSLWMMDQIDVQQAPKRMTVMLPKSGDASFEVLNDAAKTVTVHVTVGIK